MSKSWLSRLNADPTEWLVESAPWTKYRVLTDLLEKPEESSEVVQAKGELLEDPLIQELIAETGRWFEVAPKRHDDSKMSHYQLKMLARFGLNSSDPGMAELIAKAKEHREEGLFAIKQGLPEKGNMNVKIGPDFDEWHALPCDSPLITATLYQLGDRSPEVMENIAILKERWQEAPGWFCHLFFVAGQFKREQCGCPMGGLQVLELLAQLDEQNSKLEENCFAPLEYHRKLGKSLYYFGRSKKFWTLKYPFVWYNGLYLADVLVNFEQFKKSELVGELIKWIEESQDEAGRFKPSSMFRHYSKWEFANKKQPSPWITYLCCNILKRYYS